MKYAIREKPSTDQIEISLTSFADFVLKTGLVKLTCAQEIKRQYKRGYSPALDYYKKFRDELRRTHSSGKSLVQFESRIQNIAGANKLVNYELLARGYVKYWNTYLNDHGYSWTEPPAAKWAYGKLKVRVNPELAFSDGKTNYFVKLYAKEDPLTKPQVNIILHLMQLALRPSTVNPVFVLLDVRRSRPFEATTFSPKWTVVLEGEALSFERMYREDFNPRSLPE